MGLWMVLSSPLGLAAAAGIILLIAYLVYRYKAAWIDWLLRLKLSDQQIELFIVFQLNILRRGCQGVTILYKCYTKAPPSTEQFINNLYTITT